MEFSSGTTEEAWKAGNLSETRPCCYSVRPFFAISAINISQTLIFLKGYKLFCNQGCKICRARKEQ